MKKIILSSIVALGLSATLSIAAGHSSENEKNTQKEWKKGSHSQMEDGAYKSKPGHMLMKCFGPEKSDEVRTPNEMGLNISEYSTKMQSQHSKMIAKMKLADTNGDGYLSKDEIRSQCKMGDTMKMKKEY